MEAKISVIVPVYNRERYLRKCIESIQCQSFQELEIILVDDGSTDSSPAICDEYAERDYRIKVLHKQNGGVSSAVISGIALAKGEYIGFVDDDDYIAADMYEIMYDSANRNSADIVQCKVYIKEPAPESSSKEVVYENQALRKLVTDIFTLHQYDCNTAIMPSRCNKLFRSGMLKKNLCYYEGKLSYGEDLNLLFAVITDAEKVVILPEAYLYFYRQNMMSMTNTYRRELRNNNRKLMESILHIAKDKEVMIPNIRDFEIYLKYKEAENLLLCCKDPKEMYSSIKIIGEELIKMHPKWNQKLRIRNSGISGKIGPVLLEKRLYRAAVILYHTRRKLLEYGRYHQHHHTCL